VVLCSDILSDFFRGLEHLSLGIIIHFNLILCRHKTKRRINCCREEVEVEEDRTGWRRIKKETGRLRLLMIPRVKSREKEPSKKAGHHFSSKKKQDLCCPASEEPTHKEELKQVLHSTVKLCFKHKHNDTWNFSEVVF